MHQHSVKITKHHPLICSKQHLCRASWGWMWSDLNLFNICLNVSIVHMESISTVFLLLIIRNKTRVFSESAASWRVGGPNGLSQIKQRSGFSSRDWRLNSRNYLSTHINVHITGIFPFLCILNTPRPKKIREQKPGEKPCMFLEIAVFYHHFSKMILSFERPSSMRVFEMASIMGGGPHRKHKVLFGSTWLFNSASVILPSRETQRKSIN